MTCANKNNDILEWAIPKQHIYCKRHGIMAMNSSFCVRRAVTTITSQTGYSTDKQKEKLCASPAQPSTG
jgi:hypothetical protein